MAAGRIYFPEYMPARDRNGRLVSGALATIYENGTTTLASIFANAAMTTPLANPVQANSSGQFTAIWASSSSLYTVAITGPNGESIGNPSVFDDVSVSTSSSSETGYLWAHDFDEADGDGAMWRRALAAGIALNKPVHGLPGSYVLDGTPSSELGLLAFSTAVSPSIVCETGTITFTAPSGNSKALLSLTGGANFHCDNVVWDATNVSTNFAIKLEGAGDFSFGTMEVKQRGFRRVGTNGSFNGIELRATEVQGHGCSSGSATGEAFGYCDGGGYIDRVIATDVTGSGFNWSATKVINGHMRVGTLICRWTKWKADGTGAAYPTRYAALRLGNGTSNVTFGYVFAEGVYRGVRLTDTDNCWVLHEDFRNIVGPAILFNRKDQRARNSGVLKLTGVGPCRGNKRNDLGVSDKDNELIPGEGDLAGVIQEGEGWTLGQTTISADENSPGSGLITASTASATVTNKDDDYVGQDFNCFKDVVVGDLLFTTAGVVLGKVLSKGAKTYWVDAGGTISTTNPALADHATQSLTLTGNSAATVSAVAYEQRTPDDYFYCANTGNITISGTSITNLSLVAGAGTITCATDSATVTGVGSDFDGAAQIGKSLFRASDDTYIGQIADIDETLPNTILRLTANAAVALTGGAYKIGWAFTTQFDPGDLIFDASLNYVGVVATVPNALGATLAAASLAPAITNAAYRYGKLYKVRIGIEVAPSATNTNINLDDVLTVGAGQQHKVHEPQGIKPTIAQTIFKSQLATLDPTELIGMRYYVSNLTTPGWVYSDGANWVIERPAGMTSNSSVDDITVVYIDAPYKTRLNGSIATDKSVTLSDTGLPNGAVYEFAYQASGVGSRLIKDSGGSTLVTLKAGQSCKLTYEKSVPVWRVDWIATNAASLALPRVQINSTSSTSSPNASQMNGVIRVDASGGNRTITLPDPTTLIDGTWVTIKKSDTSTNKVILLFVAAGTEQAWLRTQHDTVEAFVVGSAWVIRDYRIADHEWISTSSGTWTKPPLLKGLDLLMVAGGNGGGSGRRGAAGTVRTGGNGGNGACIRQDGFPASILPATVDYVIGTGGAGGAAVTTDNTNGNGGATGTSTSFGAAGPPADAYFCISPGTGTIGGGGQGGSTTSTANAAVTSFQYIAATGSASSATGGAGVNGGYGYPMSGGSGGGITSADVYSFGGHGRDSSGGGSGPVPRGAAGTGATPGGAGTSAPAASGAWNIPPAGAGGGSGGTGGGDGGNGGGYGGAGGGGGASLNGSNSGKGGDGANGCIRFIERF